MLQEELHVGLEALGVARAEELPVAPGALQEDLQEGHGVGVRDAVHLLVRQHEVAAGIEELVAEARQQEIEGDAHREQGVEDLASVAEGEVVGPLDVDSPCDWRVQQLEGAPALGLDRGSLVEGPAEDHGGHENALELGVADQRRRGRHGDDCAHARVRRNRFEVRGQRRAELGGAVAGGHGEAGEAAERMAGDPDPPGMDAAVEGVRRVAVLLQHARDQERHVLRPIDGDLREGLRLAEEEVEGGVPGVVRCDHHEAVAGQQLGEEDGLEADAAAAVGEDDEGEATCVGDGRTDERERRHERGEDQRVEGGGAHRVLGVYRVPGVDDQGGVARLVEHLEGHLTDREGTQLVGRSHRSDLCAGRSGDDNEEDGDEPTAEGALQQSDPHGNLRVHS